MTFIAAGWRTAASMVGSAAWMPSRSSSAFKRSTRHRSLVRGMRASRCSGARTENMARARSVSFHATADRYHETEQSWKRLENYIHYRAKVSITIFPPLYKYACTFLFPFRVDRSDYERNTPKWYSFAVIAVACSGGRSDIRVSRIKIRRFKRNWRTSISRLSTCRSLHRPSWSSSRCESSRAKQLSYKRGKKCVTNVCAIKSSHSIMRFTGKSGSNPEMNSFHKVWIWNFNLLSQILYMAFCRPFVKKKHVSLLQVFCWKLYNLFLNHLV